jgi:hypothetical protein
MMELIIAIVGFVVGWYVREWHAMRKVDQLIDNMNTKMVEEFKSKVINVTVEKSGDFFYIYRKDDGTFLAQGTDIDKLSDILSEKFPGKLFNVSPEELSQLEATSK